MKKYVRKISDKPGVGVICSIAACYLVFLLIIPFFREQIATLLCYNMKIIVWAEFALHVVLGGIVFVIIRKYLTDFEDRIDYNTRGFVWSTLGGVGLCLLWMFLIGMVRLWLGIEVGLINYFPITDMNNFVMVGDFIKGLPVFGTICVTLFCPFAIAGLIYLPVFAPLANKRPWLGYIGVIGILVLFLVLEQLTGFPLENSIPLLITRLPIHLIACRSYRKFNTLWAPIAVLMGFNLIISLLYELMYAL